MELPRTRRITLSWLPSYHECYLEHVLQETRKKLEKTHWTNIQLYWRTWYASQTTIFFFVRLMRQCSCATIHLYCTPEAGMFHWYPPWREWNMPQTCPTAWLLSLLCLSRIHEEMLWPPPLGDQKLVTDDSVILPWGRVWGGALGSLLYKIIDRIFFILQYKE